MEAARRAGIEAEQLSRGVDEMFGACGGADVCSAKLLRARSRCGARAASQKPILVAVFARGSLLGVVAKAEGRAQRK